MARSVCESTVECPLTSFSAASATAVASSILSSVDRIQSPFPHAPHWIFGKFKINTNIWGRFYFPKSDWSNRSTRHVETIRSYFLHLLDQPSHLIDGSTRSMLKLVSTTFWSKFLESSTHRPRAKSLLHRASHGRANYPRANFHVSRFAVLTQSSATPSTLSCQSQLSEILSTPSVPRLQ